MVYICIPSKEQIKIGDELLEYWASLGMSSNTSLQLHPTQINTQTQEQND